MRHFARTSFGLIALGLISPINASAQTYGEASAPAGYQPASAVKGSPMAPPAAPAVDAPAVAPAMDAPAVAPAMDTPAVAPAMAAPAVAPAIGSDGKRMTTSAPAADAKLQHIHRWRKVCPACAAAKQQMASAMPPGKFVGCAHSKNGVCSACQAALNMPGTWAAQGAPAEAPGRAVVSNGTPAVAGTEEGPMSEPTPVGVVRAGYSQYPAGGMMAMQSQMGPGGMPAQAPGRAVAESNMPPGREFYQKPGNGGFPRPHILGHLFGWSGIGSERRSEQEFKKRESHAMQTFDPNAPTGVSELPASAVFGKQR